MANSEPLIVQPLGGLPKGGCLMGAELGCPILTPNQDGIGITGWIKAKAPTIALVNLQAQPGRRAG